MKNLSKALSITIFLAFGLFTAITSFPQALNAVPPGNPPTANVSPTFSGLTVTGITNLQNDLNLSGRLNRNSATILGAVASPDASYNQSGDLYAGGKLTASNLQSRGNITMSSATSNIINTATGGDVTIADNLKVTGNLNVTGSINDAVDTDVNIGEGLTVAGTTSLGTVSAGATTVSSLTDSGALTVNGNSTLGNDKATDTLKIDAAITTTTAPLNINSNVWVNAALSVFGTFWANSISTNNLTLNATTSGKIGSTYVYVGGVCVSLANTWYKIGPWGCPGTNDVITGCSGTFHQNDSSNDHYAGAFMGTDGKCYMRVKNWGGGGTGGCPGDENAAYIFAYCFDPNGTYNGNQWGNGGCATTLQDTVFGAGHSAHCPDGTAV